MKMVLIAVSGTPGTGKTRLAKELAKRLGYKYVDVNRFIKEKGLSEGYDEERMCDIVDEKRLSAGLVRDFSGSDCVIDSHLSHNLPAEKVGLCVITTCGLAELKRRLEARQYPPSKVQENLEAETMEVCRTEAEDAGHKVMLVRTDEDVDFDKIIRRLKS